MDPPPPKVELIICWAFLRLSEPVTTSGEAGTESPRTAADPAVIKSRAELLAELKRGAQVRDHN